ncbi:aspartate-semialdehyde dehydrogenase [Geobacter hydrogenophilus]|uniref:Aspartate-semialdehyde dehydrogenase n=1 Tax=Geobacter hydrogenophilus TaxID=40983 RepID=A0A9W6G1F4_9BACT|nr:aspartate-semialdehyde dehydrogenase [Geobacter hydrogenophilus]MBT0892902.1 aspartate-semialdehyde dehydrogenase [Geobacter hydrogenophilus]GLI38627.1 aspartate-semialdehyde dehydrogenase [Geobacter hydrogenophilus]
MAKLWNVAVVGATGAVGGQMIECLEERSFPVGTIRYLASSRSAGEVLEFKGKSVMVEELTRDSFEGIDIALFSAGGDRSREFCPAAAAAGAVCIDNSSAWRMDPDVPLVVPEVNPHAIAGYRKKGIIANPNCSTIQMVVALKPLHDYAVIRRVVVSTYQAVSGTGKKAIEELQKQVVSLFQGKSPDVATYPHQIAFNCLPQIDSFGDNGYTKEEMKMVHETRKILEANIGVTATAVRVPVFYGHSESVNIETENKLTVAMARELLAKAPGVELVDDPVTSSYPMAIDAAGQDLILVGRIREDESIANGLNLWVVADNIRKGAATNAVQIAEILIDKYLK